MNQVKVPVQPELFLFDVRRAGREPMLVVWVQHDSFTGEDELPVTFDWIWPAAQVSAVDALGQPQSIELQEGRLTTEVSLTPLFIAAD